MKRGLPLTVLLDEGAPVTVAEPFRAHGHRVIRHAEVLTPGDADELVAQQAILNDAALIAVDRDFRKLAKRFGNPREQGRYPMLSLIFISCGDKLAPKRIDHFMSLIEHEWHMAGDKLPRPMLLEIGTHQITSYR